MSPISAPALNKLDTLMCLNIGRLLVAPTGMFPGKIQLRDRSFFTR